MTKPATQFYVYLHLRPDGRAFYVGKGTLARTKNIDRRANPHHTHIVSKYGRDNIAVRVIPCGSEDMALETEKRIIFELRSRGINLVNCTSGGEGTSGMVHTASAKAKITAALRGRVVSPATRGKISAAHRLLTISPEVRAKQRAAATGRPVPHEMRRKISTTMTGRRHPAEARANMSAAQKGKLLAQH
jgi:predicted GIY-YIG superfamily endonuclease